VGNRPYYEIEIDRNRIARYGINVATIQDVIAMAIGGMNVTQVLEGRERYPIRVRYMREMRDSPDAMNRIFIPAPGGEHIPLGMLVNAKRVLGPAMIQSENTMT
jgi:Cu(I)/Ag(I) efflux system membrane protein CusA/SilA